MEALSVRAGVGRWLIKPPDNEHARFGTGRLRTGKGKGDAGHAAYGSQASCHADLRGIRAPPVKSCGLADATACQSVSSAAPGAAISASVAGMRSATS